MTTEKPWIEFGEEQAQKEKWQVFSYVSHVAHIPTSIDIIKLGKIKTGIVQDKSKLKSQKISVCWVSPNDWMDGYRYGSIRFNINWKSISEGKNYYWVEAMDDYNPIACRILITSNEHPLPLIKYNPEEDDGPWRYNKERNLHSYKKQYCLEFMIEEDIDIGNEVYIDFVQHHHRLCSEDFNTCRERKLDFIKASGLFLAGLISNRVKINLQLFAKNRTKTTLPNYFEHAWKEIWRNTRSKQADCYKGKVTQNDSEAIETIRAICKAYYSDLKEELEDLRGSFKSQRDFELSLAKLIGIEAELEDWTVLIKVVDK